MADTFSGLIDKLITVNLKIKHNSYIFKDLVELGLKDQKLLTEYWADETWQMFKILDDLENQKIKLIEELNKNIDDMVNYEIHGHDLYDGKFIQIKRKTY
jgi:uncharacterized protein YjaG (DUF416 family)